MAALLLVIVIGMALQAFLVVLAADILIRSGYATWPWWRRFGEVLWLVLVVWVSLWVVSRNLGQVVQW